MSVEYPNMSDNPYDYDYYFEELLIHCKEKNSLKIAISVYSSALFLFALLASPFYFNYPFLKFIQQTVTWPIVIITILSISVVFGTENYCYNALKESIKKKNYKYLTSQVRGHVVYTKGGFSNFVGSSLVEAFIVLLTYIAYSNTFFFGLNYLLAGCFFLSAIAIKSALYNSWNSLKTDLKSILREEYILIEDLVKEVEDWKITS